MSKSDVRDIISQESNLVKGRSRPWHRTSLEVRDSVLQKGEELLRAKGLGLSLGQVSLETVVREADVPRASAYRLWADRDVPPQAAFHEDLLIQTLGNSTGEERRAATLAEVWGLVEPLLELTPAEREPSMAKIITAGSIQNIRGLACSNDFAIYIGICAAFWASDPSISKRVREALQLGEATSHAEYVTFYSMFAEIFGLELRVNHTMEQFVTVTSALSDGLLLRVSFKADEDFEAIKRDGRYDDEGALFADGFLALLDRYFTKPSDREVLPNETEL